MVIPEFALSTEKARAVLPSSYTRADAIFNIQRSALTIAALTEGNCLVLREAMRDRIHQPYRTTLIPGLTSVLALDVPGLFGVALSGAGPTILALTDPDSHLSVGRAIVRIFAEHGIQASSHRLDIDTAGRQVRRAESSNANH